MHSSAELECYIFKSEPEPRCGSRTLSILFWISLVLCVAECTVDARPLRSNQLLCVGWDLSCRRSHAIDALLSGLIQFRVEWHCEYLYIAVRICMAIVQNRYTILCRELQTCHRVPGVPRNCISITTESSCKDLCNFESFKCTSGSELNVWQQPGRDEGPSLSHPGLPAAPRGLPALLLGGGVRSCPRTQLVSWSSPSL